MEYSNTWSKYPDEPIPVGTKKDIDNNVKSLVSKYYSYMNNGDINNANRLYEANKTTLEKYIVNAQYFNRLEEEIYNTGVKAIEAFSKQTIVVSDTEPSSQVTYSHWLKEW